MRDNGRENNKLSFMSLSVATPPLVVDGKEKDVVFESLFGSNFEVRSPETEAYEVLRLVTKFVDLVHEFPFQGLLEAVEKSGEDTFFESVSCELRSTI